MKILTLGSLLCSVLFVACVPKQQYEDQKAKLRETQDKLRDAESAAQECDPSLFLQMKEQTQSLDLLSQELLDRNTELSKEVARLRTFETEAKTKDQECTNKLEAQAKDNAEKVERLRRTYEDLIKELRAEIKRLEDVQAKMTAAAEAAKAAAKPKTTSAQTPKSAAPKANSTTTTPKSAPPAAKPSTEKKPSSPSK